MSVECENSSLFSLSISLIPKIEWILLPLFPFLHFNSLKFPLYLSSFLFPISIFLTSEAFKEMKTQSLSQWNLRSESFLARETRCVSCVLKHLRLSYCLSFSDVRSPPSFREEILQTISFYLLPHFHFILLDHQHPLVMTDMHEFLDWNLWADEPFIIFEGSLL